MPPSYLEVCSHVGSFRKVDSRTPYRRSPNSLLRTLLSILNKLGVLEFLIAKLDLGISYWSSCAGYFYIVFL